MRNLKKGIVHSLGSSSNSSFDRRPLKAAMLKSGEENDDAHPSSEEYLDIHDSLLELYLNVKIRNFDKTIDSEKVDEELDKLK